MNLPVKGSGHLLSLLAPLLWVPAMAHAVPASARAREGATGAPITACANPYGPKCSAPLSTGVTVSYVDMGPPRGRPVIFLHGYTDSSMEWARVMVELHRRAPSLRLIAVDQRGAGGGTTDLPNTAICRQHPAHCETTTELAKDITAFAQAINLARFALVGHSMGSVVARQVALAAPDRVSTLVLVSTPSSRPAGTTGPTGIAAFPEPQLPPTGPLSLHSLRAALAARDIGWPAPAYDMRLIDFNFDAARDLLANWVNSPIAPEATRRDIAARMAMVRLKYFGLDPVPVTMPAENLENLTVPTLVLWGKQDTLMTLAMQKDLIASLRAATMRHRGMRFVWKQYGMSDLPENGEQTDIGHEIVAEAPTQLAADIDSFLKTGWPTPETVGVRKSTDGFVLTTPANPTDVVYSGGF